MRLIFDYANILFHTDRGSVIAVHSSHSDIVSILDTAHYSITSTVVLGDTQNEGFDPQPGHIGVIEPAVAMEEPV
jgi:hypothetical protein